MLSGHVFHDSQYKQYLAKGDWVGKTAGGVPRYRQISPQKDAHVHLTNTRLAHTKIRYTKISLHLPNCYLLNVRVGSLQTPPLSMCMCHVNVHLHVNVIVNVTSTVERE
jgi:hypothetical protein